LVKNLTITISDELSERLKSVRKHIKVAAVCRSALENAIEFEELKLQSSSNSEKYQLKLKQEKQMRLTQLINEAKQQAFQDGFNAPEKCDFEYEDFLVFEAGDLPDWFSQWFPRYIDSHTHRISSEICEHFDYQESFIQGILAYWEKIKGKI